MKDKILLFSSKIGLICPGWTDACWSVSGEVDEPKLDETFRNHANNGANATREIPYYGEKIRNCTPFMPVDNKHNLYKKNVKYFDGIKLHLKYAKKYNLEYWQSLYDGCAIDKDDLNAFNPWTNNTQGINGFWKSKAEKYRHQMIDWFISAGVKKFELCNEPKSNMVNALVSDCLYLVSKGIGWRNINMGFQHDSAAWNLFKRALWAKTDPYDSKTDMFSSVHQFRKNKYVERIIKGQYITRRFFLSFDGDRNPRPNRADVYNIIKPLFNEMKAGRLLHIYKNQWGFEVLNHSTDGVEDSIKGLSRLYFEYFGRYPINYGKYPVVEEPEKPPEEKEPEKEEQKEEPKEKKMKIDFKSILKNMWAWLWKEQGTKPFWLFVIMIVFFILGLWAGC